MMFLDFETRSTVDLKLCGSDVYSRHPSTEVMCVGLAYGEDPAMIVKNNFHKFKMEPDTLVVAQNAAFELNIWNNVCVPKYGWPPLLPSQVICSMAQCYAMALPGALADSAPALGLNIQKDSVGHRVMMQLSQPRKVTENGCLFCTKDPNCNHCYGTGNLYEWYTPKSHPEKFEQLYSYCKTDIDVEREVFKRTMRLSPQEQKLWELDYAINQRGVSIDLSAVRAAMRIVDAEQKRFNEEMREVTNNAVATATATGQLTDWLHFNGIQCAGVAKADVADLLKKKDLTPQIRRALEIRQSASLSSTAKLKKMVSGACEDGRARGLYQYHGAGATGRFAGRRIQLQNLKRSIIPQSDIEGVFRLLSEME